MSPPNTVCETALPCKNLITTLFMLMVLHCFEIVALLVQVLDDH